MSCLRTVAIASLLCSCATVAGPPPSPLPPLRDIAQLVPPPPRPLVIPPKVERFADTPVAKGECRGLPAGILIDHGTYGALSMAYADRGRLIVESATLLRLRNEEHEIARQVEQAWRTHAAELEQSLARERSGASWKYLAAAATGGLIVFVTVLASRPATR